MGEQKIFAITKDRYQNKYFKPFQNFSHAQSSSIAQLVVNELKFACMNYPIIFTKVGENFMPAAMLGFGNNNLFVKNGQWLYGYIPAVFRAYPFKVADDGKQQVVCIDEASGTVTEESGNIPFYDEKGELSEQFGKIVNFISEYHRSEILTKKLCSLLNDNDLFTELNIQIQVPAKNGNMKDQKIKGLYAIDERKFLELEDSKFIELKNSGVLVVVYAHLFSLQHINALKRILAGMTKDTKKKPSPKAGKIDSGDIQVDWDKLFKNK
jgi:hypothetical protein